MLTSEAETRRLEGGKLEVETATVEDNIDDPDQNRNVEEQEEKYYVQPKLFAANRNQNQENNVAVDEQRQNETEADVHVEELLNREPVEIQHKEAEGVHEHNVNADNRNVDIVIPEVSNVRSNTELPTSKQTV